MARRRRRNPTSQELLGEIEQNFEIESAAGVSYERIICGEPTKERADRMGMDLYDLSDDVGVRGPMGVHVGDADEWLPILLRDGYCNGKPRAYTIRVPEDASDFFVMEDPHPYDRTVSPDSMILFSVTRARIPSSWITLDHTYTKKEIQKIIDDFDGEEEGADDGW